MFCFVTNLITCTCLCISTCIITAIRREPLTGHRQSIWWWSRRRSNEFSKREIAGSTRSNPTDKSKPTERHSTETHREVDRDVYREVDQHSTETAYQEQPWSRLDGHRSGLRTTITESSSISESMPLTNGNWQKYSMKYCTKARENASAFELIKYHHLREAYVLDIDEWDETALLTYTIDDHRWLWSMPSHERKLYHPDDSDQELRRDMNHECSTGWHVGCCMSLGVDIRRNWGPRLRSGGNGSIEFQNWGPVQMASARVFTTFGVSQVEVEFLRAPDPPKGHPERYWSVVGLMSLYEYVRGMIV